MSHKIRDAAKSATAFVVAFGLLYPVGLARAETWTFRSLYSFTTGPNGYSPTGTLFRNHAGNLFGTTASGGTTGCAAGFGCGTVFRVTPEGKERVLYTFKGGPVDGAAPNGDLISDKAGNFYGTTSQGGIGNAGVVYKLSRERVETVLYSFCSLSGCADGNIPNAGLLRDRAGNFYGTTYSGGAYGVGSIFKITPDGTETVLYSFGLGPEDGSTPHGGLITDNAGNLFGTTLGGGAWNDGTVYKWTPNGELKTLYSFYGGRHDGATPTGKLVVDNAGNMYGTTAFGGFQNSGVVFKIEPNRHESVLHSFNGGNDGIQPTGDLIIDRSDNIYGVTSFGGKGTECANVYKNGCGIVFKIASDGKETIVHYFNGSDGYQPDGGLTTDDESDLIGTTGAGGSNGFGTAFVLQR